MFCLVENVSNEAFFKIKKALHPPFLTANKMTMVDHVGKHVNLIVFEKDKNRFRSFLFNWSFWDC